MKRKVFLAAALFLAFGVMGLHGQQAATQGPEGAVLTGVWSWQCVLPVFGPDAVMPSLVTFNKDGTVLWSDGLFFGGLPTVYGLSFTYTPYHGVWERTGPHQFRLTAYALRFNRSDGVIAGIARVRTNFTFADDFDHIAGTNHVDTLACPTPLTCPDPLTAPESSWVPWPINPISFHAARISVVPY